MKLYYVLDTGLSEFAIAGTLDAAKAEVNKKEPVFRSTVHVIEVDHPTDKPGLIAMHNNGGIIKLPVVHQWHGTARGGLKEMTVVANQQPQGTNDDNA